MSADIDSALDAVFAAYQRAFAAKIYSEENDDHDLLMDVFQITPERKRENRQYWGRELGMCWQLIVTAICKMRCPDFQPALRLGADTPCDLIVGHRAIDTKYRIGSGDSGTLKKFKAYGPILRERSYEPVLLIVREDNLPAAITACRTGGWTVLIGESTYLYLSELTQFDVKGFLARRAGAFPVER